MYTISKIIGFHGLKGEIKLPYSERLEKNLSILDKLYVYTSKDNFETLTIEYFKIHKTNILIKFKEYNDKTLLQHLLKAEVKQYKENLAELDEEEYLIDSLINLQVFDQNNNEIGKVLNILSHQAADTLLEIQTLSNQKKLIPFVEELVPAVDIKNKKIIINNIPGLIEDEI